MNLTKTITSLAVLGAAFTQTALAIDVPSPLVEADWLNAHKGEVVVLQVSGPLKAFTQAPKTKQVDGKLVVEHVSGHVPGAHFVDFKKVRVTREVDGKKVKGLIPEKAEFEKLARSWGVNADSAIVFVPAGLNTGDVDEAARLYWQFKYYGQGNMAILDGGMAAWLAAGYPAATDAPSAQKGDWSASTGDATVLATYSDVKSALEHKDVQLADARPQNQYMGVFTKPGERSGHLMGAVDISPDLLTRADGASARFLPARSYDSILQAKGLDNKAAVITYCNTGHLASGLWFVTHEIMGNKQAKLYDGSLVEYSLLGGETVDPARLD
jgi:thiosulfate/3-mercaptopyruvate sulfurtransferase